MQNYPLLRAVGAAGRPVPPAHLALRHRAGGTQRWHAFCFA
jgi:hypothetical protein